MAKKNSTKTATKEALQASEPKIQTFRGWNGINISEVSPDVDSFSTFNNNELIAGNNENQFLQTDIPASFLMLQNNAITTDLKAIETRFPTETIVDSSITINTGISCMVDQYLLYVTTESESNQTTSIHYIDTSNRDSYQQLLWDSHDIVDGIRIDYHITKIGRFQNVLIILAKSLSDDTYRIFKSNIEYDNFGNINFEKLSDIHGAIYIDDPPKNETNISCNGVGCSIYSHSDGIEDAIVRYHVTYCISNEYGSTRCQETRFVFYTNIAPEEMTSKKRIDFTIEPPSELLENATAIDLYYAIDEYTDLNFMGHIEVIEGVTSYTFSWLGGMQDTSIWQDVSLYEPTENTTAGVDAEYFASYDGRLFFWGGSNKQRLYVGGNAGHELSVARGWGGAYIDIDPGSSSKIMNCHRFKTQGGAACITVLCNNSNSTQTRRYNIIETTTSLTNELTAKSYYAEEVSNVIGCVSHFGSGTWADGLYSLGRYGLTVTTHTMEYNSQLRSQSVSDAVKPLFTDLPAHMLDNARVFCLDDIIYISFANEDRHLDNLILCYDINLKAWYTFSVDVPFASTENIREFIAIDSIAGNEGLGIITNERILFIPITGKRDTLSELDQVYIESHDLSGRVPPTATIFLCQGEFRFDWFVGEATITIEGMDYYGRPFSVVKKINHSNIEYKLPVYLRVDRRVETYRIKISGTAQFRLTHVMLKAFTESNKIDVVYGFDSRNWHTTHHHGKQHQHHEVTDYNNLKRCIVP